MELRQLEYFKAIVDNGTISEAARKLHMTQPPLSYQMHQLEEELGVNLFVRGPRRIELTEAGGVLYRRAASLLDYSASVTREIQVLGSSQTLHIGSTPTTVSVMVPLLRRYASRHPKVRFEVYDGNTFHLKELLGGGVVDICLIRTPVDLQKFHSRKVRSEKMLALEAPATEMPGEMESAQEIFGMQREGRNAESSLQNRWEEENKETVSKVWKKQEENATGTTVAGSAADIELSLEELVQKPLIIYRRYRDLIMETFLQHHLSPQIFCECDDARTAIHFAQEGLGTALVPESIAVEYPWMRRSVIDAQELETDILLAWRDENSLVQELVELSEEMG